MRNLWFIIWLETILIISGIILSSKGTTRMKIKEGDKLPDAKVFVIDTNKEYEHKEISTSEILNREQNNPIWSTRSIYTWLLKKTFAKFS